MSKAPYRAASHRSEANVDFAPPAWWRPHSANTHLLTETRQTVQRYGAAPFMTWLDDKGNEEKTLSFDELWERSRRLARRMRDDWGVETGDRVLLCYLPGLAFVEAFWACLRLRCVAVPTYPPDPSKLQIGLKKLDLVKKSCGASLCLTEKALDSMRRALSLTHRWPAGLVWKSTDRDLKVNKGENDAPLDDDSVAFLQYTSGSTGDPKGVMLTFANVESGVLHASRRWRRRSSSSRDDASRARNETPDGAERRMRTPSPRLRHRRGAPARATTRGHIHNHTRKHRSGTTSTRCTCRPKRNISSRGRRS